MKRILAAGAAALALFVGTANPVYAGGSGDFYKTTSCTLNGVAKFSTSNYDIATGQRYHFGLNQPSGYTRFDLYVDGVHWKSAGSARTGTLADGYIDFSNAISTHFFRAYWRPDGGTINSCVTPRL